MDIQCSKSSSESSHYDLAASRRLESRTTSASRKRAASANVPVASSAAEAISSSAFNPTELHSHPPDEDTTIDEPPPKRVKATPRSRLRAAAAAATAASSSSSSARRIDDGDIEMTDAQDTHAGRPLRVESARTISSAMFVHATSLSTLSSDIGSSVFQYLDLHSSAALARTQRFWHGIAKLRASYYVLALPKFGSDFDICEYRRWRREHQTIVLTPKELIIASQSPAMKFVPDLELELDIFPMSVSYDLAAFQVALAQFHSVRTLSIRIIQRVSVEYDRHVVTDADRALTAASVQAIFHTWSAHLLILDIDGREDLHGKGFESILQPLAANLEILTELRIFQCMCLSDGNQDPFSIWLRFHRSDVVIVQLALGWFWFEFPYRPPVASKGHRASRIYLDPCDSRTPLSVRSHASSRTGVISSFSPDLHPDHEDEDDWVEPTQAIGFVRAGVERMLEQADKHFEELGIMVRECLKNPTTGESVDLTRLLPIASSIRCVNISAPSA